jgi:low affinity Fe/Cu permease
MGQRFANFANRVATLAGHYVIFVAALAVLIVWESADHSSVFRTRGSYPSIRELPLSHS